MGQLFDNMKSLALEDDKYFIARSRGILHSLDKKLVKYVEVILEELEQSTSINRIPVLYVPVSHHVSDESRENKIKEDITDILNLKHEDGDLIAIGEALDGDYTLENRKNQTTDTLQKLSGLGVIPKKITTEQTELINRPKGFEQAILAFAEKKKIVVKGVESPEGAIIATVLESNIEFTYDNEDGAFRNEIKYRIGIEARTRLCLQRANKLAKSGKVIFFQGGLHLEGVKGWCGRNSVILQTIVPNCMKNEFRGRNSTLKLLE